MVRQHRLHIRLPPNRDAFTSEHDGPTNEEVDDDVFKRQISVFLPLSDWKLLRKEAARLDTHVTKMCLKWLEPHLKKLRKAKK